MDYKSRRERRTAHHGKIDHPRGPLGALIVAIAPKKKRDGGKIEGEAGRKHLGRRARGGKVLDAREAANQPDGVDKDAQRSGTDEREVEFGSPRKQGGRADGGRTPNPLDWTPEKRAAWEREAADFDRTQGEDTEQGFRDWQRMNKDEAAHNGHARGGATKWIGEAREKMDRKGTKGALHRQLGVKQGEKIPEAKLEAAKSRAERTGNVKLERRVQFAENVRK